MLGGGTFTVQNKVLPGTYINFVSSARATATLSDRGYAAIALELNWGAESEVIELTSEDFIKNSLKILGYSYTADEVKPIREIFLHATTLYLYRLNGGGTKASNDFGTAKHGGTLGNSITIVITEDETDDEGTVTSYTVTTLLNSVEVDSQSVASAADLVDNDYVVFDTSATLTATAGTPMTGGENLDLSDTDVAAVYHQAALTALEGYSFNTLGCASADTSIQALYIAYTKRLRDEVGVKFQTVVYNNSADYEGIINVLNPVKNDDEFAAVYWTTGASAGCAVNASLMNTEYDGEYDIDVSYSQTELENYIEAGYFVFHKVGSEVRVLRDINSFVSTTTDKNEDFGLNQVIRVLDQIANDVATVFNDNYCGKVPNDKAGRYSLWADICKQVEALQDIRAVEDFDDEDCTVDKGDDKVTVVVELSVSPVCAMEKLYMTVYVC